MNQPSSSNFPSAPSTPSQPSDRPENFSRILIADDDKPLRSCIADLLGAALGSNFEIIQAADGKAAIHELRADFAGLIHTVLTDFKMPFFDGLDVAEEALSKGSNRRVILSSGLPSRFLEDSKTEERIILLKSRGLLLFPKPYNLDELQAVMRAPAPQRPSRPS